MNHPTGCALVATENGFSRAIGQSGSINVSGTGVGGMWPVSMTGAYQTGASTSVTFSVQCTAPSTDSHQYIAPNMTIIKAPLVQAL